MAAKTRRKKKPIQNLRDLKLEKEKLRVAIEYSEENLREDWQDAKGLAQPQGWANWVNNALPLVSQFIPVSKMAFQLMQNLFSGKADKGESSEEEAAKGSEEAEQTNRQGWGKRLTKGFFKNVAPFLAGTLASAAYIFSGKNP